MIGDMSDAVAMLAIGTGTQPTTVTVTPGPSFVDDGYGRPIRVEGTPWVARVTSVQPIQGKTLDRLPEGSGSLEDKEIWLIPDVPTRTLTPASTETGRGGDTILLDGLRYEVTLTNDWRAGGGYLHVVARKQRR